LGEFDPVLLRTPHDSEPFFLAAFHMLIFPLVALAAFVIAPAAWGIAREYRVAARSGLLAFIWAPLYIAAFAIQIGLTWPRPLPLGWWPGMFVFYAHWPVFYAIAVLYWRRWRSPQSQLEGVLEKS
jgi:hypothetical protein